MAGLVTLFPHGKGQLASSQRDQIPFLTSFCRVQIELSLTLMVIHFMEPEVAAYIIFHSGFFCLVDAVQSSNW